MSINDEVLNEALNRFKEHIVNNASEDETKLRYELERTKRAAEYQRQRLELTISQLLETNKNLHKALEGAKVTETNLREVLYGTNKFSNYNMQSGCRREDVITECSHIISVAMADHRCGMKYECELCGELVDPLEIYYE